MRTPVFAVSCLLPLLFLSACTQTPTTAAADPKVSETEARKWLDDWTKAFQARDVNAIMALYAPDVIAYDIVPPLQWTGRDSYGKDYATFLAQYDGPVTVEYARVHVVTSGDLAEVFALEHVTGTIKGQKADNWLRVSSTLRKTDGKWLDVHDHVSVPTDMATGKAMLDLKP
jgi:uncharacterized protein (TIGR02246 family)